MKKLIIPFFFWFIWSSFDFTQMIFAYENRSVVRVSPQHIIVDDYKGISYAEDPWHYSRIGTDRGEMGDGSYTVDIGGGSASVAVTSGWAGVWTSLIHKGSQNHEIDPIKLLGPYIKSQYQARIVGVEVDIIDGTGQLKVELKDRNNNIVNQKTFLLSGGSETLIFTVSPTSKLSKLSWLVDGVGYVEVDEVRLEIDSPDHSLTDAAFLFTYGHLCQCYDADRGLVRDRARWPVEDCAAVQTIGMFALATAIGCDLGYIGKSDAVNIISKTKSAILNLPQYHGLFPHFLPNNKENTEWSSVDTVITLISEILACQAAGIDTSQLEALIVNIDWDDLTDNGTHSISMGYDYSGNKLLATWDTFGSEALLMAVAYSAATGNTDVLLDNYDYPPTWDGSGFNDELAALFFSVNGIDIWNNDWFIYRQDAFDTQYSYFSSHYYESDGLFGLSAGEVPEPWNVADNEVYQACGVGGHNGTANDGSALLGCPIIAPHYAAMIAKEHPLAFEKVFQYIFETQSILTPLNNVESFGVDSSSNIHWSSLKGAWNLSLQVLGLGRALYTDREYLAYKTFTKNDFLFQGFTKIIEPSVMVIFPNGGEDLGMGRTCNVKWTTSGLSNNLYIVLQQNGSNVALLAKNINPYLNSYTWIVGECLKGSVATGDNFKILLMDKGATVEDKSDTTFSICNPSITVTVPNGGENWTIGDTHDITWNHCGLTGSLYIILLQNNTIVALIAKNIDPDLGTYSWTVGDCINGAVIAGSNCKILIAEKDTGIRDKSDEAFVISE